MYIYLHLYRLGPLASISHPHCKVVCAHINFSLPITYSITLLLPNAMGSRRQYKKKKFQLGNFYRKKINMQMQYKIPGPRNANVVCTHNRTNRTCTRLPADPPTKPFRLQTDQIHTHHTDPVQLLIKCESALVNINKCTSEIIFRPVTAHPSPSPPAPPLPISKRISNENR